MPAGPDERAPGLEDHAGGGEAVAAPLVLDPAEQRAGELADLGRALVLEVLDAEAAAEVDDLWRPAELVAAVGREGGEPVDAHARGERVAQVRAEVEVQAGDVEPGGERAAHGLDGVVGRQAELGAVVAGADGVVGVRVDAGGDPHEHAAHPGGGRTVDVVVGVDTR